MNATAGQVRLEGVAKAKGGKAVLDGLALDIPAGKFTAVIGPSGCGKTTMIDLIAGYDPPDSGSVTMDGAPVRGPGWDRLVVFQETALFPWKSTLENVMFGPRNSGLPRDQVEAKARGLLSEFGLAGFEQKYPGQLSGGMQRRAELARALINSPKVMLFDEPFRGLDALTRELMQEYLLRVFDEHPVTTVFVTSEVEESIYLADRVIVLSSAPTRTKKVIDIDLPRPRDLRMLTTPRFAQIHAEILECLFEEAAKAFQQGAKGAADLFQGAASYHGRKQSP
jgi:NitT/TauT family transport system ATP-binding protein